MNDIEILRDYSFRLDFDNIKNKVQDKSVMLTDLEEKIEEELNYQNYCFNGSGRTCSRDFAIYWGLIRYREYLRKHALTLLCDRKTAASIRAYNSNLSQFARNYMYLDEYKDVLEKANKENESKALVKTKKM